MIYCELCEDLLCDNEVSPFGDEYGHKVVCHHCLANLEDIAENGEPEPLSGMYLVKVISSMNRPTEYNHIPADILQEGLDNGGLCIYNNRREKIKSFHKIPTIDGAIVTMGGMYGCD